MKRYYIFFAISGICIIGILLFFLSTKSKRLLTQQIVEMQGMSLNLNFNEAETYLDGIDSIYISEDVSKLVLFVDSLSCSSCSLSQMTHYYDINDSLTTHGGQLVVILHPQQISIDEIRKKLAIEKYPFWCVIDKKGEFLRNNPKLSDNKLLHTFLVDKYNRIILIGDPMTNSKIKELFLMQLNLN